MSDELVLAGPVLAADFGGGAGALVVVVLLFVAAGGLFVAMSRSLRRMRANVTRGEFRGTTHPAPPAPSASPDPSATPDPPSGRKSASDPADAGHDNGHAPAGGTTVPPQR